MTFRRFVSKSQGPLVEFHLRGDGVELVWLVDGLDQWMSFDSIVDAGRELRPSDGAAFYDALERAWPGCIEAQR